LPEGRKPSKIQFLVGRHVPQADQSGGYLQVTVPSILLHEVIAVDFDAGV
jgi:hypothetical protein